MQGSARFADEEVYGRVRVRLCFLPVEGGFFSSMVCVGVSGFREDVLVHRYLQVLKFLWVLENHEILYLEFFQSHLS